MRMNAERTVQRVRRIFPVGHLIISLAFVASAIALLAFAVIGIWHGIWPLGSQSVQNGLNGVLEGIAVLTVALAALELGETILEEEVLRGAHMSAPTRVRRFLSRFMVVLVVALSIETLVLVFRFSQTAPEQLVYAASVGIVAALLLAGWGIFVHFNRGAEKLEPEAMDQAKREDEKLG